MVSASPAAVEVGEDVARHQAVGAVASRAAQRIGVGDIPYGEHAPVSGHAEIIVDANEPAVRQHVRGEPRRVR
ncbi:hypothetical protein A5766_07550 [Gordonia sp. 852002-51296_SCH5728562-b]|nr:hypothetical protein A5766_07550 [Gordonia sp. 852002-51296_SCH5728562-b]